MKIRCFNVGQGSSVLLQFPPVAGTTEDRYAVVDCFYSSSRHAEPPVLSFLKDKGVSRLLFVAITHPDQDHCRGMSQILEYFSSGGRSIGYFLESFASCYLVAHVNQIIRTEAGVKSITPHGQELVRISELSEKICGAPMYAQYISGTAFNGYVLDRDIQVTFVAPSVDAFQRKDEGIIAAYKKCLAGSPPPKVKTNEASLALRVATASGDVLLGGDVPSLVWEEVLPAAKAKGISLASDLIVVTHHGSEDGNPPSLWRAISHSGVNGKKSMAVISCGFENRHDHPTETTLNRIISKGNTLYCTNLGAPCLTYDVCAPAKTPKILIQALQEINKDPLERALSGIAAPIAEICSGTVEVSLSKGVPAVTHRDQNSRCVYAETHDGLDNPY